MQGKPGGKFKIIQQGYKLKEYSGARESGMRIFLVLTVISLSAFPQYARFFKETSLVQVPVLVLDKHHRPITNLNLKDFILKINGIKVNISYLQKPPSVPAATINNNDESSRNSFTNYNNSYMTTDAHIIFLFDTMHVSRVNINMLCEQLKEWLMNHSIASNEDIAIYEETPGLIELQPFTRNQHLLSSVISEIGKFTTPKSLASVYSSIGGIYGGRLGGSAIPLQQNGMSSALGGADTQLHSSMNNQKLQTLYGGGYVSIKLFQTEMRILSEYMSMIITRQQYYGMVHALNSLADNLHHVPGHKIILWFTNDTDYTAPGNPNLILSGHSIQHLIHNLNASNISLFPIDPDGLSTYSGAQSPGYSSPYNSSMNNGHQAINQRMLTDHDLTVTGATTFATKTGGMSYFDINSSDHSTENVLKYSADNYIIYFNPNHIKPSRHKYYKINVHILVNNAKALYRHGYISKSKHEKPIIMNSSGLKKIALLPIEWTGLPLKATLIHNKLHNKRIAFKVKLPIKMLIHHARNLYVYDFTGQIMTINLKYKSIKIMPPDRFKNKINTNIAHRMEKGNSYYKAAFIFHRPGIYMARIIIRDNYDGNTGTVTIPIGVVR